MMELGTVVQMGRGMFLGSDTCPMSRGGAKRPITFEDSYIRTPIPYGLIYSVGHEHGFIFFFLPVRE